MIIYKNFKDKLNLSEEENKLKSEFNVIFKESEDGMDWYELTRELSKKPTFKIVTVVDKNTSLDTVVSFGKDSTGLNIMNEPFNLVEVETIPDGLSIGGFWVVDSENKKIYKRDLSEDEIVKKNTKTQKILLNEAYQTLTPLNYAVDLDMATSEDIDKINKLKAYIIKISRLNLKDKDLIFPDLEG